MYPGSILLYRFQDGLKLHQRTTARYIRIFSMRALCSHMAITISKITSDVSCLSDSIMVIALLSFMSSWRLQDCWLPSSCQYSKRILGGKHEFRLLRHMCFVDGLLKYCQTKVIFDAQLALANDKCDKTSNCFFISPLITSSWIDSKYFDRICTKASIAD